MTNISIKGNENKSVKLNLGPKSIIWFPLNVLKIIKFNEMRWDKIRYYSGLLDSPTKTASKQVATGVFPQSVLPVDRRRWWRGHMPLKQEQASPERPRCMGGANEHWGFRNPVKKKKRGRKVRQRRKKIKNKLKRKRIFVASVQHWFHKGQLQPKRQKPKLRICL